MEINNKGKIDGHQKHIKKGQLFEIQYEILCQSVSCREPIFNMVNLY